FFPAKILGAAGDAGAVAAADRTLADRMRLIVNHGRTTPEASERLGYNYRLDALQAAVLEVKLAHVERTLAARRRIAVRYAESFGDLPVEVPRPEPGHAFQAFCLLAEDRDALAAHLARHEVATATHYRLPLHRQRAFAELPRTELPTTERLAARTLC